MGFQLSSRGSFKTEAWLQKVVKDTVFPSLDEYGRQGVAALSAATPTESGATSSSWYYEIKRDRKGVTIEWRNNHMAGNSNVPVAVLLQYGHGTGTGGYVQGRDFINPAIQPIMDRIAQDVWKVVTS
jgi:hypothetical protein